MTKLFHLHTYHHSPEPASGPMLAFRDVSATLLVLAAACLDSVLARCVGFNAWVCNVQALKNFLPIVLIALIVQIFAPTGACWAASIAASERGADLLGWLIPGSRAFVLTPALLKAAAAITA